MHRWLLSTFVLVAGCPGPGGGDVDGGIDGGSDAIVIAPDTGVSCAGYEEGTYQCTPGIQCCGGTWHPYSDGACLVPRDAGSVDAGPHDAGPPDCTGSPERAGCPCTAGAADVCVPFADSLRCESGTWTRRIGIACCVSP